MITLCRRAGRSAATVERILHWGAVVALTVALVLPAVASAQRPASTLGAILDAEFWDFFTSKSEPGGGFLSDNFVSNEVTYQHVIPSLQRSLKPQSVYLGVGPEQNFTYIAALKPQLAVIFDIRRQNAMQHLMFKALFELAPSRAEFVARLFSRPAVPIARIGSGASALFTASSTRLISPEDAVNRSGFTGSPGFGAN